MASAAAVMFLAERVRPARRASLKGLAEGAAADGGAACAKVKSGVQTRVARTASLRIMIGSLGGRRMVRRMGRPGNRGASERLRPRRGSHGAQAKACAT